MTRVLGLDLSLASTGVALPGGRLVTIATRKTDDPGRRLHLIAGGIAWLIHDIEVDVIVIEDLLLHGKGAGGAMARAKLLGCVERDLFVAGIPYVLVNPSRLKRWATGHGDAPKAAMGCAAVGLGYQPQNDDEADAACLRSLGLMAYGELLATARPTRDVRLEVVAAITWPVL